MIAQQHRFHGYRSLGLAYRRGTILRNQHLSIRFWTNQRRDSYRAAIVVSRKIHKSAVDRNRLRRRLYEIIRLAEPRIKMPYDIVLTVLSDQVLELPAAQLTNMIMGLMIRAGIVSSIPATDTHAIVETQKETV